MDIAYLTLAAQTISSLSIAGGFIFAAVQFRHIRRASHVANFSRLVELQMQIRRMKLDNPKLAGVYKHDVTDLHNDEEVREYFLNLIQLSVFEIAWFSHRHGQIPDDYFQSWVNRMKDIEGEESFRKMMSNPSMKIMHDDFLAYMKALMSAPPEKRGKVRF